MVTKSTKKEANQEKMAVKSKTGSWGSEIVLASPKKSRQGNGKHTKYSATSRNSARKRYRGQGK